MPSRLTRLAGRYSIDLVHSMPADEAALLAGVGDRFEAALESLEYRVAIEKYPAAVAAHRTLPRLVYDLAAHVETVEVDGQPDQLTAACRSANLAAI